MTTRTAAAATILGTALGLTPLATAGAAEGLRPTMHESCNPATAPARTVYKISHDGQRFMARHRTVACNALYDQWWILARSRWFIVHSG